jgi:hypothetical protein
MRSTLDSFNRLAQQLTEHPHLAELYYRGLDDFESLEGVDSRTLQWVYASDVSKRGGSIISTWRGIWVDYAKFRSRSHHAVVRVYDDAGNVIKTYEHTGDFKE